MDWPHKLRHASLLHFAEQQPRQDPSQERFEKQRKLRSDAKFASPAVRQAAYRARLKENRRASLEQLSPANETDSPGPDIEELPATLCQAPVTETSPENADPHYSACYSPSVEGRDISAGVSLLVTPEACSEREELWVTGE